MCPSVCNILSWPGLVNGFFLSFGMTDCSSGHGGLMMNTRTVTCVVCATERVEIDQTGLKAGVDRSEA